MGNNRFGMRGPKHPYVESNWPVGEWIRERFSSLDLPSIIVDSGFAMLGSFGVAGVLAVGGVDRFLELTKLSFSGQLNPDQTRLLAKISGFVVVSFLLEAVVLGTRYQVGKSVAQAGKTIWMQIVNYDNIQSLNDCGLSDSSYNKS